MTEPDQHPPALWGRVLSADLPRCSVCLRWRGPPNTRESAPWAATRLPVTMGLAPFFLKAVYLVFLCPNLRFQNSSDCFLGSLTLSGCWIRLFVLRCHLKWSHFWLSFFLIVGAFVRMHWSWKGLTLNTWPFWFCSCWNVTGRDCRWASNWCSAVQRVFNLENGDTGHQMALNLKC